MEILADENIPWPMILRLRQAGYAVHSIAELRAGIPDVAVLAEARRLTVVLMTQDRDFGELTVVQGIPVAGVILVELERLSLDAQVQYMTDCLSDSLTQWIGRFSVIEPGRIRQRLLDEPPGS